MSRERVILEVEATDAPAVGWDWEVLLDEEVKVVDPSHCAVRARQTADIIVAFERRCAAAEYMDTEEALALLREARSVMRHVQNILSPSVE